MSEERPLDDIVTSSFGFDRTVLEASWCWEPVWESAKRICLDQHLLSAPHQDFGTPVFSEGEGLDGSRWGRWTSEKKDAAGR